ncbi:MAG: T9SS type A sorting domain-containing protein [Bacteroidota bacterium]
MKRILQLSVSLLYGLFCISNTIGAQDCNVPSAYTLFGNEYMRVALLNGGDAFWNLDNGQYFIPYEVEEAERPTPVFAGAIWLGGIDPGGNLRIAAQTYRQTGNDFWAGPLDANGQTTPENCSNFDQIWKVDQFEIEAHIADWEDNSLIDGPITDAILYWPGRNNPYFEVEQGFVLPDQDLAPFYDRNNDGLYDPLSGDYPVFEHQNPDAVPRAMAWMVFNDNAGAHTVTGGTPLQAEIQQTYWIVNSENYPQLNYTLFRKDKIINRGAVALDSVHFSSWLDADLGCYDNDFTGSIPECNTFYFYNGTSFDNNCGVLGYGNNPPVFAHTFLNANLSTYRLYIDDFSVTGTPDDALDFYEFQTGRFVNGDPVEYGGTGFQQGTFPYPWYYPTNPNDSTPGGWSEVLNGNDPADRAGVGSSGPHFLAPGASIEFDQAFSFFQDAALNHLETVDLLYSQIPLTKAIYDEGFSSNQLPVSCTSDCIWPGDTNQDGIVDGLDVLRFGITFGQAQSARTLTSNLWAPYEDPGWTGTHLDGVSYAASDCNGSGTINAFDLSVISSNIKSINDQYQGDSGSNLDGPELYLENVPLWPWHKQDTLTPTEANRFNVWLELPAQEQDQFTGISFELSNPEGYLDYHSIQFDDTNTTGFDLHFGTSFGTGLTSIASVSSTATPAPPQSLFLIGQFDLRYAFILDQCSIELNIQNVQVIRADGSVIPVGSVDRIWPSQCFPTVSTEDPLLDEILVAISPNPASSEVSVEAEGLKIEHLQLMDIHGRSVSVPFSSDTNPTLKVDHLPKGLYLVRIQTDQGEVVKRLIVQ